MKGPSPLAAFEACVATGPDRAAVLDGTATVTYAQLDRWADGVTDALRRSGVKPGDHVALRLHPGAPVVAAILGILRAGAAYIPLDQRNPRARNELIFRTARPRLVIADDRSELPVGVPVLAVPSPASAAVTRSEPPPGATAYVIFTSGTTGEPKGVPITHANLTALLNGVLPRVEAVPQDRWSWFHSIAFDFSVWEIWGALTTGGAVVVVPPLTARDPDALMDLLDAAGVTVFSQTPTAFAAVVQALEGRAAGVPPSLRLVVFGGEKLTPGLLAAWTAHRSLDRPALANLYGITEITVHATFHWITSADVTGTRSHIGRPLPGFAAVVVDENDHEVSMPGDVGELLLGGPQVTPGYLNRPDLTAERFTVRDVHGSAARLYRTGDLVEILGGGEFAYVGRSDLQVKIRGHRIELSDVEAAVRDIDGVIDAVALVQDRGPNDRRLVCAYLTATGMEERTLRACVSERLPAYMVPSRFRRFDRLPTTVNGKIDRKRVAELWIEPALLGTLKD